MKCLNRQDFFATALRIADNEYAAAAGHHPRRVWCRAAPYAAKPSTSLTLYHVKHAANAAQETAAQSYFAPSLCLLCMTALQLVQNMHIHAIPRAAGAITKGLANDCCTLCWQTTLQ